MSVVAEREPTGLRGSQRPGLLHLPRGSDAYVDDALDLLGEWGFTYDDAQQFVIASSLREMPDGRWAAKEVGLEEPRQNGKGELIEGRECLGLFYLDERKLIHSAHEFATASEALDRMEDRIGRNPKLKHRVKSVKRSHGEEGVYLKDGRSLRYKTRTKGGGRGFSADLLILDEAMYIAEAFLGALMPVISARPNPQMWYTGSAVDQNTMDNGIVFARLRQRALEHRPGRVAYFGWSAAYKDGRVIWSTPADVPKTATDDPEVIGRGNPALGDRIALDHVIESELQAMSHETYCVERLGVGDWPDPDPQASSHEVSLEAWRSCKDAGSKMVGPIVLVYDVRPDRSWSTICAAGHRSDGLRHVEVVAHRKGAGWVAEKVRDLQTRHTIAAVAYAAKSPASALTAQFEEMGIEVEEISIPEHAEAYGQLVDGVANRTFRHLGQPEHEEALSRAARRPFGDSWVWSRRLATGDDSPLVAATLALWRAGEPAAASEFVIF